MLTHNGITYPTPRLSASTCSALLSCSWSFFCSRYLKIPERVWPRTLTGSLVHIIFEVLQNPRHKKHYDTIVKSKTIESCAPIMRLIKFFRYKNPTLDDTDLNKMVLFGLSYKFFPKNFKKLLPPEYEFNIKIKNNVVKGFIDKGVIYEDFGVAYDFKSQKDKFSKKKLENNLQAQIYQFALWKIFKIRSSTEFILLRHEEIQTVPALSIKELTGVEKYLEYLEDEFEKFDENAAKTNFRAETDRGFCDRVCSFKNPKTYYAAFENGQLKETSMDKNKLSKYSDVRVMSYPGCFYFYTSDGRKRNFN